MGINPSDLKPLTQVALEVGRAPSRVRQIVSAGLCPAESIGGRWYMTPAQVEKLRRVLHGMQPGRPRKKR